MFKIKKYVSIEFFVVFLWALADLTQALIIINTHIFSGDFFPWRVTESNAVIIFIFLSQFLLYIFVYKFYISFIKEKRLVKSSLNLNKHLYKFIDYFFLSLLMLNIIFYISGFITVAGSHKFSSLTFIIHLVSIHPIFPIYYFLNRNKNNKIIYATNIILYFLLQIAEGWSGIFFQIFLFELYFRSRQRINFKFLLLLPIFFAGGAFLYQFIYPMKLAIRAHTSIFNIKPISFIVAANLLIGRLSMIGNLTAIFQYKSDILRLLNKMYPLNFEILKFIRAQIPSFIAIKLFPHNIFLYGTIGYILWLFKIGCVEIQGASIGFGPTLLGTSYLLLLRNPIELILFYLFTILIIFCIKIILDTFGNKDIYFPFFLNLIYFIHEAGEISMAFGELFFSLTSFFLIILFAKTVLYTLRI